MSVLNRVSHRVSAALTRETNRSLEDQFHLLHAVKNELWGRLEDLSGELAQLHESIRSHAALSQSSAQREAAETRAHVQQLMSELHTKVDALRPTQALAELHTGSITDIDDAAAQFLNYAASHIGPLRDRGLWINHPVSLRWANQDVSVGSINERIIEQPFVMSVLAALPAGAKILDIGGGESTLNLSLASLGLDVTVVEPQGYPFRHPNLEVIEQPLEDCTFDHDFDAVVLLSTIEHFGIGHYANNPERDSHADLDAMATLKGMLRPGGIAVITTPYGIESVDEVQRVYGPERFARLIEGFNLEQQLVGRHLDDGNWLVDDSVEPPVDRNGVMMAVLSRPADA